MMSYLFIGLGGALGAMARVALCRIFPSFILSIPFKILCVNVIGCFAMGLLTEVLTLYWNASTDTRHFLVQGLLGGFTTFSAFSLEFGLLYQRGLYASAILYAALSVSLSLLFFFGGLKVIRLFS